MFDFKCNKCNKVVEKIVSHKDVDKLFNCDCEEQGTLQRVERIGKTSVAFKGRWFSNTGGY